ncbi:MAG: RHS repeat protein [Clostridiales bacterium]|nr:RHS repeat protein [Clostridiales bacterium]
MKMKNKLLASILSLLMVVCCSLGFVACGETTCSHRWDEWTLVTDATCTEQGVQERVCFECGEKETENFEAYGHNWKAATCSAPKTCKTCGETTGGLGDHAFVVEWADGETRKSNATCTSGAVYYKSCECGAISDSDENTFTLGEPIAHQDNDKDHTCDFGCGEAFGECADGDFDHACDYGCDKVWGECVDEDKDHACDYGCAKIFGLCADNNKDHACDYGCDKAFGECADGDKDHDCDYGCDKILGEHTDGDDNDHLCDYGCGLIADEGCYDVVVDGACDECGAIIGHVCEDADKDHACDSCSAYMGVHEDTNSDHNCEYCGKECSVCVDTNSDHKCDYEGCGKTLSECVDDNKDHKCDYAGCAATLSACADEDKDHKCDFTGCKAALSECIDENKDHYCDYAGCGERLSACADDNNNHVCDYESCQAKTSECGDKDNNHICDYKGCKATLSACADENKDHKCDYTGCNAVLSECKDEDKNHDCDYTGCNEVCGAHTDGDDNDHLCDYGCGVIADDGCYDTVVNGKCDECGADINHECVDAGKDHACDICSKSMGEHEDGNKDHACDYGCTTAIGAHEDTNKDHKCDYGCATAFGVCEDANADHACDYGCNKVYGTCVDADKNHDCDYAGCAERVGACVDNNKDHTCDHGCGKSFGVCEDINKKDHACDYGCDKTFGECKDDDKDHVCDYTGCTVVHGVCADSNTDNDHVCDYGCKAVLEDCTDAENDGDHICEICGNIEATAHTYSEATCAAPATCSECGATEGSTIDHIDENKDHKCDNGCGKNDMGECADSNTDDDHVCDYGCNAVLEDCIDAENDADHACDVCGKEDVTAHKLEVVSTTNATCYEAATKTLVCNCGHEEEETVGAALGHNITGVTPFERQVAGCEYEEVYECAVCGDEVIGETVYKHKHIASIATPATCANDGLKVFVCACGDEKEPEVIPADATGHNWVEGNVVNGTRTDTCSVCNETKEVTVYTGTTTDEINASDLANKEIALNNANISLGSGVADAIGDQNVTVSADKVEGTDRENLGLGDKLAQVGDSPIYNFTINNGEENISNFGENNYVTITLPYELQEGEDVDSIAIWFITDEGEIESISATYNNGYVTFKTNHFSYYTVTRLTPAERCALYGHGYAVQHVEGSCTKDSYDLYVCVRCHDKYEANRVVADGHNYTSTTNPATCTASGSTVYTCTDCNHTYRTKINATGHKWALVDSAEKTCTADGFEKYGCEYCDDEYTITYVKLSHVYTRTTFAATCTSSGYTLYECDNCDYSYTDNYVEALGHDYNTYEFVWEANGNKAVLNLACSHDATHITSFRLTDSKHIHKEVTKGECSNYVIRKHTATIEVNGVTYTDTIVIEQGNPSHTYSANWTTDDNEHWHECICGAKTDVGAHAFDTYTVTKQATCAENGEKTSYCECGKTQVSVIPKTGKHNYENGTCTGCGATYSEDYYVNLITSIKNINGFAIVIENLSYEFLEENKLGELEIGGYLKQMDIAELVLYVEDGELKGAAIGSIVIFNGPIKNAEARYDMKAYIEGEYMYIVLAGDITGDMYIKMSVEAWIYNILDSMDISVSEMSDGMISFITDTVLPMVDTLIETNSAELNAILEDAFNIIFTFEQQGDGSYVATLDFDKLYALNENLATKSIAEVVDIYFGEGAFDYLVEWALEVLALEPSEIPAYLDELGFDSAELIEKINELARESGAPADYDINDIINEESLEGVALGMLIFEIKDETYVDRFNEVVGALRETSVYEMLNVGSAEDFKANIDDILDAFVNDVAFSFTTDSASMIQSINLSANNAGYTINDMEMNFTFDLEITINGRIDATWSDIVDEIENNIVLPEEGMLNNGILVDGENNGNSGVVRPDAPNTSAWESADDFSYELEYDSIYSYNDSYDNDYDVGYDSGYDAEIVLPEKAKLNSAYQKNYNEMWSGNAIYQGVEYHYNNGIRIEVYKNDYNKLGYIMYRPDCSGWIEYQACYARIRYQFMLAPVVIDGSDVILVIDEYTREVVGLFETENGAKAVYEDGTEKEIVIDVEGNGGNIARVYADIYFQVFEDAEGIITWSEYVDYYYNAEKQEYANNSQHELEYEYIPNGERCGEDGTLRRITCKHCDYYQERTIYYCEWEYDVVIDFAEYTECGGKAIVNRCAHCGYISHVRRMDLNCKMSEAVEEEIFDENGQVIGYQATSTCLNCGLVFVEKAWTEHYSVCGYTEYRGAYIYKAEDCIFEYVQYSSYEEHDYQYEYELYGDDCNSSYKVIETCTKCDYKSTWRASGHRYESFEINLGEYGCEGYIGGNRCAICKTIDEYLKMDIRCNVGEQPTPDEVIGEDGIVHYVMTATCPDCGLRFVVEQWSIVQSICVTNDYQSMKIYSGEDCIFDYTQVRINDTHNYEYTYEWSGETPDCNQEYKVNHYCTKCGEGDYWYGIGHKTDYFHTELSEYGACGGWLEGESCVICGELINMYGMNIHCPMEGGPAEEWVDEYGNIHTVKRATCPVCGLTSVEEWWSEQTSSCVRYEYNKQTISINGVCIFEDIRSSYQENHNYEYEYEFFGEGCEDGYRVTQTCTLCGQSWTHEGWGHRRDYREVYLTEYGFCGGRLEERYCSICDTVIDAYIYDDYRCDWQSVGTTPDGYTVQECARCGGQKLFKATNTEKDENCYYQHTESYVYIMDEEEVCRSERTYGMTEHNYTYSFDMNGESCKDGYTVYETCTNCGHYSETYNTHHNTYTIYRLEADGSYCEEHHARVYGCPCGYSYAIEYDIGNFNYDVELGMYVCEDCDLVILNTDYGMDEGCYRVHYKPISIILNGEAVYEYVNERRYANHNFVDAEAIVVDGMTCISVTCSKCNEVRETTVNVLEATMEYHGDKDGQYYYDYTFTPSESASYTIRSLENRDTYVRLYEVSLGQLIEIGSNDDGADNLQFLLTSYLTEGKTYIYRIGFLGYDEEGTINFMLTQGVADQTTCNHNHYDSYSQLLEGSESCEDGNLYFTVWVACGCIGTMQVRYDHYTVEQGINLGEFGACYGEFYYRSCACGQSASHSYYNSCAHNWSDNSYYDENGQWINVEARTCSNCGLRYDHSYYSVKDRENCTLTTYHTVLITINGTIVVDKHYQTVEESHDYTIVGTLMNGEGSTCEDGVTITYTCKDCEYSYSYETHSHETFAKETIDLFDVGSVCGGYAYVYGCACGYRGSLELDSLCDDRTQSCNLWIEDALRTTQYNMQYIYGNSYGYSAYVYICAVTDPADRACAYKIRYASYWLKDENSCTAYQYQTWQFGYNQETDTWLYEVTFKTGSSRMYHDYIVTNVDTDTEKGTKYDCPDCGSYHYYLDSYDAEGRHSGWQRIVANTLDNSYDKYREEVYEYAYLDGSQYTSRDYYKVTYSHGSTYWRETLRTEQVYEGTFGYDGREVLSSYSNSNGSTWTENSAYVWHQTAYRHTTYTIYTYHEENGTWYRYDYTYTFGDDTWSQITVYTDSNGNTHTQENAWLWYKGYEYETLDYYVEGASWYKYERTYTFEDGCGCTCTTRYTNSDGADETKEENVCKLWSSKTLKAPTCTQDGLACYVCEVCEVETNHYTLSPNGHSWHQIREDWYYCFRCGLENANGTSGSVIMEDLTATYGNGENYVVGYYAQNNVAFTTYISLIWEDNEVAIWSGIDFIEIEGIRAYAFSKAQVDAWATENGYTGYDIRFSFVPDGADGSFDYGITFTEMMEVGDITTSVSFTDYVGMGETKVYTITPTANGTWTFTSRAYSDTYVTLCDAEGNYLAYDDDSAHNYNNFLLTYYLEAGKTYQLHVRWYHSDRGGSMPLVFTQEVDPEVEEEITEGDSMTNEDGSFDVSINTDYIYNAGNNDYTTVY